MASAATAAARPLKRKEPRPVIKPARLLAPLQDNPRASLALISTMLRLLAFRDLGRGEQVAAITIANHIIAGGGQAIICHQELANWLRVGRTTAVRISGALRRAGLFRHRSLTNAAGGTGRSCYRLGDVLVEVWNAAHLDNPPADPAPRPAVTKRAPPIPLSDNEGNLEVGNEETARAGRNSENARRTHSPPSAPPAHADSTALAEFRGIDGEPDPQRLLNALVMATGGGRDPAADRRTLISIVHLTPPELWPTAHVLARFAAVHGFDAPAAYVRQQLTDELERKSLPVPQRWLQFRRAESEREDFRCPWLRDKAPPRPSSSPEKIEVEHGRVSTGTADAGLRAGMSRSDNADRGGFRGRAERDHAPAGSSPAASRSRRAAEAIAPLERQPGETGKEFFWRQLRGDS